MAKLTSCMCLAIASVVTTYAPRRSGSVQFNNNIDSIGPSQFDRSFQVGASSFLLFLFKSTSSRSRHGSLFTFILLLLLIIGSILHYCSSSIEGSRWEITEAAAEAAAEADATRTWRRSLSCRLQVKPITSASHWPVVLANCFALPPIRHEREQSIIFVENTRYNTSWREEARSDWICIGSCLQSLPARDLPLGAGMLCSGVPLFCWPAG